MSIIQGNTEDEKGATPEPPLLVRANICVTDYLADSGNSG